VEKIFWFDTHCHLDFDEMWGKSREILRRADENNVRYLVVPGTKGSTLRTDFPENVLKSWGIHPFYAEKFDAKTVIESFENCPYKPIAVGECGLDADLDIPLEKQTEVFVQQVVLARENKLPLMIHLRKNWEKALKILKTHGKGVPWVFHAFCGSVETARLLLREEETHISFAGSLCYRNAVKTPMVAKIVPEHKVLLETDSPDICPPNWKESMNEPSSLPIIGRQLCCLRQAEPEDLIPKIFENSRRFFNLTQKIFT